ncbi:thionin-like protein 2 [Cucumis sativus]|uniref:thionin-like protein 2 n=1 Tax=Cucumis sativus TaxID=3659 RepID=UPI0002B4A102|nr:thionin-like protein 2 [Cucumis sativus]KAE8646463.1 hypothetical protein Csa_015837 [Cucumis sativus]
MRSVVLICFILSLVAGKSTAVIEVSKCYLNCMAVCAVPSSLLTVGLCALKCTADCIAIASSPMNLNRVDTRYFCKLGCATSCCTKSSTKKDFAEKKVESCVNTCDQICMKA